MSLDRLQSKFGQFVVQPEVVYGTTGTASTVGSNQYPGGFAVGSALQLIPGTIASGGGAPAWGVFPAGVSSTVQAFATTGIITHAHAPIVVLSVSTTGIALNMQPAAYHGQMLTIVCVPGTTCSLVSTLNTTGVGGTTTAACAVLDQAYTFASTACPVFVGLAQLGGTATTNVSIVWRRVV